MNEISLCPSLPEALKSLPKPPERLFHIGDCGLLERRKISIVGTRRPIAYTKEMTRQIARRLKEAGFVVVSGAAMGVDAIAHMGAFPDTIAVMGNSLEYLYPAVNRSLIEKIYNEALALSEYEKGYRANRYSFVVRNRIVVALGEALIITQADIDSGTMRSARIAMELGKPIYVLPHRLDESPGTRQLLEEGAATPIWNLDTLIEALGGVLPEETADALLEFVASHPTLQEALDRFGERVYEYELEGKIVIERLKVRPV